MLRPGRSPGSHRERAPRSGSPTCGQWRIRRRGDFPPMRNHLDRVAAKQLVETCLYPDMADFRRWGRLSTGWHGGAIVAGGLPLTYPIEVADGAGRLVVAYRIDDRPFSYYLDV